MSSSQLQTRISGLQASSPELHPSGSELQARGSELHTRSPSTPNCRFRTPRERFRTPCRQFFNFPIGSTPHSVFLLRRRNGLWRCGAFRDCGFGRFRQSLRFSRCREKARMRVRTGKNKPSPLLSTGRVFHYNAL